jgi:[protein-PII] uridylyltransferase
MPFTTHLEHCSDIVLKTAKKVRPDNPALAIFKQGLNEIDSYLNQSFAKNPNEVIELVKVRASIVDQFLKLVWRYYKIGEYGAALVAVGGYGRGELHPESDVDLLILLRPNVNEKFTKLIESFLMMLWDLRLDVGHSVRTIDECISLAEQDITIATNLLEARFLIGNRTLYQPIGHLFDDRAQFWPSPDFYSAKKTELEERQQKYGDAAYNLEPNIKSNPGGLRDIQVIGWVLKRHFGAESLADLVEEKYLRHQESLELLDSEKKLWMMRYALHCVAKRKEERLLFDYQPKVAELLGYENDDVHLGVEKLMREYYRTVNSISELHEMLLQHFEEVVLKKEHEEPAITIDNWFLIRKNRIEVRHNQVFLHRHTAMLEMFLHIANFPQIEGISAGTLRLLRHHRHLIDQHFRRKPINRRVFYNIITNSNAIKLALPLMKKYQVLNAYLPAFANITGQMQFDLFHCYTVDAHTFRLLKNLNQFAENKEPDAPFYCHVMQRLKYRHLLNIAGLFHDIAKGRGGDHSVLGEKDARDFCDQHTLPHYQGRIVAWLVRQHLLMSGTAQRQDITDPDVVNAFAAKVADQTHLDLLYVLTVADIQATNGELWTSWKDALLRELYQQTKRALRRGLENTTDRQEIIGETRLDALSLLTSRHQDSDKVTLFWDKLDEDYFIRYSPETVAWHTEAILSHCDDSPLVMIRRHESNGGTEVFFYTQEKPEIFANVTSIIDQLGLNIVDAAIETTSFGYCLDSFVVLTDSGNPIEASYELQVLKQNLIDGLLSKGEQTKVTRRTPRKLKCFSVDTRVSVGPANSEGKHSVEITTKDRPGLLACIGRAFLETGLTLHAAKIATLGERVEDVFVVSSDNVDAFSDQAKFEQDLAQAINQQLN